MTNEARGDGFGFLEWPSLGSVNQLEYRLWPGKVRNAKVMTRSLKSLSMLNGEGKFKMSSEKRVQGDSTEQVFSSGDRKTLVCRHGRETDTGDREAAAS